MKNDMNHYKDPNKGWCSVQWEPIWGEFGHSIAGHSLKEEANFIIAYRTHPGHSTWTQKLPGAYSRH